MKALKTLSLRRKNLLNFLLDHSLLGVFRNRNLFYDERLGLIEHFSFSERQIFAVSKQEKVPQNFGDFINLSGFDFFHVITITAIPRRLIDFHIAHLQNRIDPSDVLIRDDAA